MIDFKLVLAIFIVAVPTSIDNAMAQENRQTARSPSISDYFRSIGVSANVSHTQFEGTLPGSEFEGRLTSAGGTLFAHWVTPDIKTGLSLHYEEAHVDTLFNQGEVDTNGFSVSPQLTVTPFKKKNVQLNFGGNFGFFDNDAERANGTITGGFDSVRLIGTASLTGSKSFAIKSGHSIFVDGGIEYRHLTFLEDAYQEAGGVFVPSLNISRDTISFGGRLGYSLYEPISDRTFVLYGLSRLGIDVAGSTSRPTTTLAAVEDFEDTTLQLGGGVQVRFGQNFFTSFQGTTTLFRDDFNTFALSGSLNYRF